MRKPKQHGRSTGLACFNYRKSQVARRDADRNLLPALWLFRLCLAWQQAVHDRAGQAKTHFYLGLIFRELYHQRDRPEHIGSQRSIELSLSRRLFPDQEECGILRLVFERFSRDGLRLYARSEHAQRAVGHLQLCLRWATDRCGESLIEEARRVLGDLPQSIS